MRNFIDIVNEVAVVDNGRLSGCAVWKNPSSRDLQILAADRDLRGLVDGNTVYVWPAENGYAPHDPCSDRDRISRLPAALLCRIRCIRHDAAFVQKPIV